MRRSSLFVPKIPQPLVVWAENRDTKGGETELTEAFLKVLQRNKKLDEADKPTADAE